MSVAPGPILRDRVRPIRTLSCFSGIGGLDLGLEQGGCEILAQCESWRPAQRVLASHWPHLEVHPDIATAEFGFSDLHLLAAGFPCADISHAGAKAGISGPQSGLVAHVFRLAATLRPKWVLLENVPNLLRLQRGDGMRYLIDNLAALGYRWAYRVVDVRFTGLPQRRHRVLILAGRDTDPAPLLLGEDAGPMEATDAPAAASGFYWTEGRHGVGLVPGAIPTLKGGSTIGLPSAPAVWFPTNPLGRRFLLPAVEDGEALQGLPRSWTAAALAPGERDERWKLIGNAVPPTVGAWLSRRLATMADSDFEPTTTGTRFDIDDLSHWPEAAYGTGKDAYRSPVTKWPQHAPAEPLSDIVSPHAQPLSHRATSGFLKRLDESRLRVPPTFYSDLEHHQAATRPALPESTRAWTTTRATSARMRRQPQRDTKPELMLRRHLHALGLRYRLQYRPVRDLRRRLDIVFPRARVAVDVRGCFWHACPRHATKPTLNAERWSDKLSRNAERDADTTETLLRNDWTVVVVWEHDDPAAAAHTVAEAVSARLNDDVAAEILYIPDVSTGAPR